MNQFGHVLLENAVASPCSNSSLAPANCEYDPLLGAWVVNGTTTLLVETRDPEKPSTKKNDIETGEDLKGE